MEKTVFIALTQAEQTSAISRAIIGREAEIFGYELNIENYETMLLDQNLTPAFRSQILATLQTELSEHAKASALYKAMCAQLPAGTRTATVLAEKAKIVP